LSFLKGTSVLEEKKYTAGQIDADDRRGLSLTVEAE
jgi:hypothetical protein